MAATTMFNSGYDLNGDGAVKSSRMPYKLTKCLEYEMVLDLMLREPWEDYRAVAIEARPMLEHIARYDLDKARVYREALVVKARSLVGEI